MIACSVFGCTNSTLTVTDPVIQYYYFPKHPALAQQWLSACYWRDDQIDTSTARICSVHFDSDSYTNEYKLLDYIGCYTKVLKYDAVPTLYLPNSTPIIIKSNLEDAANSEALTSNDLKNIIVYTMPVQEQQLTTTNFEPINEQFTDSEVNTEQNEKYLKIKNNADLDQLKQENIKLQNELASLKSHVDKLQNNSSEKSKVFEKKDAEYACLRKQYHAVQTSMLTLDEQKKLLAKVFSESQIKILSGKKKIYWSNDDMAVGYTIRHLSNKRCYMYLSKNLNIPLPALSSLKRWATLKKGEFQDEENN